MSELPMRLLTQYTLLKLVEMSNFPNFLKCSCSEIKGYSEVLYSIEDISNVLKTYLVPSFTDEPSLGLQGCQSSNWK